LLVEDEPDICYTLAIGLRQRGFYVAEFSDPLPALLTFEPGLFDLALLDVRMSKMSGFELYMKLREKDTSLNVCFLTAFEAFEEFKTLFPELATRHFMKKPAMISSLIDRINLILSDTKKQ